MNLDETQALDLGQYADSDIDSDDEQEPKRNRKLVGKLHRIFLSCDLLCIKTPFN